MSAAASALRALRRTAGLSQEQLAERAQVSERTIRALESGRAARPHRETLVAIAAALDLDGDDRLNFVASWRGGLRALGELVSGPTGEVDLRAEFDRQRSLMRDIAISEHVRVGPDRRWISSTVRRTFEVLGEGLDHLLWLRGFMPELIDGSRLEVYDCVNVEVSDVIDLPEWDARAWQGSLRGDLRPGEIYSLRYTFDWATAHRPSPRSNLDETLALTGLVRPVNSVFVEIEFDPAAVPDRAWAVSHAGMQGPEERTGELPISPFGVVQLLAEPAASAAVGIRWSWDDPR